jgi:hypothetical protein
MSDRTIRSDGADSNQETRAVSPGVVEGDLPGAFHCPSSKVDHVQIRLEELPIPTAGDGTPVRDLRVS